MKIEPNREPCSEPTRCLVKCVNFCQRPKPKSNINAPDLKWQFYAHIMKRNEDLCE